MPLAAGVPGSLPAARKTAGWEEEKCQEMEEGEMVREVTEAGCSDEGGGLQACWQPSPQVRGKEQREEICDKGADMDESNVPDGELATR